MAQVQTHLSLVHSQPGISSIYVVHDMLLKKKIYIETVAGLNIWFNFALVHQRRLAFLNLWIVRLARTLYANTVFSTMFL